MRPPRYFGILIYSLGVSAISLAMIWLTLHVGAPKVVAWHRDLGEAMELPGVIGWVMANTFALLGFFWPTVAVVVLLVILGCVPRIPQGVRSLCCIVLPVVSIVLTIFSGLLFLSIFVAAHEIYFAQLHKTRVYEMALEEFALREAAENRWDEAQKRMAGLANIAQKRIESAEELSRSARLSRVAQLARAARDAKSPEMQKRILATLSMFRDDLSRSKGSEEVVLTIANRLADQSISNSKEFFLWLDQNAEENGWEPIPLYLFTTQ